MYPVTFGNMIHPKLGLPSPSYNLRSRVELLVVMLENDISETLYCEQIVNEIVVQFIL